MFHFMRVNVYVFLLSCKNHSYSSSSKRSHLSAFHLHMRYQIVVVGDMNGATAATSFTYHLIQL